MNEVKISNREVVLLNTAINNVLKLRGVKFAYAIARTSKLLDEHITAISKAREPSEEYKEFFKKREEVTIPFVKKEKGKDGKEGEAIKNPLATGFPFILENGQEQKLAAALKPVFKKYKKAVEDADKQDKDILALMEEEVIVKIYTMFIDNLPEGISLGQIDGLIDLIEANTSKDNSVMVEAEFSNQAILSYHFVFELIFSITNPEIIKIMIDNLRIIKKERSKLLNHPIVKENKEYEEERTSLCEKFCSKDPWGFPKMNSTEKDGRVIRRDYVIPDKVGFDNAISKLGKDMKDITKRYKEFSETMVKIKLYPIPMDLLPDDISVEQMSVLADIVT